MDSATEADLQRILGHLATRGIASAAELQSVLGKSQPTLSRLLAELSGRVLTLGRARATRYGIAKSIRGLPSQQPIWWTGEDGTPARIGTLSLLGGDLLHVDITAGGAGSHAFGTTTQSALPWFLSPLQAQGFLGRLLAQRLAGAGIEAAPERWNLETVLFAALHLHDAAGAISIGEPWSALTGTAAAATHTSLPANDKQLPAVLDQLAADVARTLPAGSSAGGEQPKFLALLDDGRHVLVKFTPPRGTPFGERWADLLQAEALASQVLAEHGVPVADTRVVDSAQRRYLLSARFDRLGARGRRHVVAVGAAHQAFVPDAYMHWAASCEALARQRRLSPLDARRAEALLHFGRLIGNTDMHSGNLGLFVALQDLARGRFTLAPVYDMLPMRWRPDAALGGAADYAPFEPDPRSAASPAVGPARAFWQRLAAQAGASRALRSVAAVMADKLGPSA